MDPLYKINETATAAEEFDGEMIVIQFQNGTYSTLSGSGKAIFRMLETPVSVASIVRALGGGDNGAAETMREQVQEFIGELERREMLVRTEVGESASPAPVEAAYEAPGIETFEDLSELLKIDPVHEVDLDIGWPNLPE